jgi:phosphoribosylamine--glycine ligase
MAVSGGYPGSYQKNFPIAGIELAQQLPDSLVFQAGTGFQENTIVTKGGRVLTVTCQGTDLQDAVQKAQKALSHIQFEGMYFRKDIGYEFA